MGSIPAASTIERLPVVGKHSIAAKVTVLPRRLSEP